LIIVLCGFLYLRARYCTIYSPIDALKKTYQADEIVVDLYYADPESDGLKAEQRSISPVSSLRESIANTLHELIRGPRGNLINAIPENTKLENVRIEDDGVVWVDFSAHLSSAHPGGSSAEIMTVYSIVNTILINFKEVEKVRIVIEGATVDTLAGHIDCTQPFVADRGLIH
jgi:spore germination protein GerM